MPPAPIPQAFALALQHHHAGRFAEAERLYLQIVAAQPDHAEALQQLGIMAYGAGRADLAAEWFLRGVRVHPQDASAHSNLGEAYRVLGQCEKAISAYRDALGLNPGLAEAHNNLGLALRELDRGDEALASYERALAIRPGYVEALNNLAIVLAERGRVREAEDRCRQALQWNPNIPEVYNTLGGVLGDMARLDEAVAVYRRALQIEPGHVEVLGNLGGALARMDDLDGAIAAYRRALELRPRYVDGWNNLGYAYKEQGLLDEAAAAFRHALALQPSAAAAHSNLIYTLHFHPGHNSRTIAEEHGRWNRQFEDPLRPTMATHENSREPGRRLRIGYVSPDFRFQAEAFFVAPLFEAHDHQAFEIHAYASVARPDAITLRLRQAADVWHDVQGRSDHEVAQQIRADGIDILVDLTMHMARNRLRTFALKPAPIQVAWLAYPGSTGLQTMDYRITDLQIDPPGEETPFYAEKSMPLPDCWCCYDPLADGPPVAPSPAGESSPLTFGCLNNFCKINGPTIALFSLVLQAVPDSRLLLLAPRGSARPRILGEFQRHGIPGERIQFMGRSARPEYLQAHERIDIALDTLPYNGITTTCDALWMGVPVVTLRGKTAAGRAGDSILTTVQLPELVAGSPEEFVHIAQRLAHDRPALARLRATLRPRVESSPLMDAPRFARHLEAAYRTMWSEWCAQPPPRA